MLTIFPHFGNPCRIVSDTDLGSKKLVIDLLPRLPLDLVDKNNVREEDIYSSGGETIAILTRLQTKSQIAETIIIGSKPCSQVV